MKSTRKVGAKNAMTSHAANERIYVQIPLIRNLRKQQNKSQGVLAKSAGLSKRTVQLMESSGHASVDTVHRIAAALGTTFSTLTGEASNDQQPPSPTKKGILSSCPSNPTLLVGREPDLRKLKRRLGIHELRKRQLCRPMTVVHGLPGVGKSSILSYLAHDVSIAAKFADGILWAALGSDAKPIEHCREWADALGLTYGRAWALSKFRAVLSRHLQNLRVLMIIDDAWSVRDARALQVTGTHGATLISTRRIDVAEDLAPTREDMYPLRVLNVRESMAVLESLAPTVVRKHRRSCIAFAKSVDGLPLALQVAGKMLDACDRRGLDVEQILQEVEKDATRLLDEKCPADMVDLVNESRPSVAAILRKSTDLLDEDTQVRFAYMGALAAKPATFELGTLMRRWKVDENEATKTMSQLIDHGLVEATAKGRYQMHALLVTLARSLCEE